MNEKPCWRRFHKLQQRPGTSVQEFAREMEALLSQCAYRQDVGEALAKDRLVVGLQCQNKRDALGGMLDQRGLVSYEWLRFQAIRLDGDDPGHEEPPLRPSFCNDENHPPPRCSDRPNWSSRNGTEWADRRPSQERLTPAENAPPSGELWRDQREDRVQAQQRGPNSNCHPEQRGPNYRPEQRWPNWHPEQREPNYHPEQQQRGPNWQFEQGGPNHHSEQRGANFHPQQRGPNSPAEQRGPNWHPEQRGPNYHPEQQQQREPDGLPEQRGANYYSEQRGTNGFLDQRGPNGHPEQRGPNYYSEQRGPNCYSEQRGPNCYSEQRGPNYYSEQRGPNGFPEQRGPNGFPEQRGPNGFPEQRGPNGFPEQRGPNGFPEQRGQNCDPEQRGPNYHPQQRGPNNGHIEQRGTLERPNPWYQQGPANIGNGRAENSPPGRQGDFWPDRREADFTDRLRRQQDSPWAGAGQNGNSHQGHYGGPPSAEWQRDVPPHRSERVDLFSRR